MSPYQLCMLLDVWSTGHISAPSSPIYKETVQGLIEDGWFRVGSEGRYDATEKLKFFVDHIASLPAPVQKWQMP